MNHFMAPINAATQRLLRMKVLVIGIEKNLDVRP